MDTGTQNNRIYFDFMSYLWDKNQYTSNIHGCMQLDNDINIFFRKSTLQQIVSNLSNWSSILIFQVYKFMVFIWIHVLYWKLLFNFLISLFFNLIKHKIQNKSKICFYSICKKIYKGAITLMSSSMNTKFYSFIVHSMFTKNTCHFCSKFTKGSCSGLAKDLFRLHCSLLIVYSLF